MYVHRLHKYTVLHYVEKKVASQLEQQSDRLDIDSFSCSDKHTKENIYVQMISLAKLGINETKKTV